MVPSLDANSITGTKNKTPQISQVLQPFSSFGGMPAESMDCYSGESSFYRRVSQRLSDKDRVSTVQNWLNMAYDACMDLYYVCMVQRSFNQLCLGVVRRYANAHVPGAFNPVLGSDDLQTTKQYIAQRTPAFIDVEVGNVPQQEVKVSVNLSIAVQTSQNELAEQINQNLRLYLSPWINASCGQMPIAQGINRTALIQFLRTQDKVLGVNALSILSLNADGKWIDNQQDPVLTTVSPAIFVSAERHIIEFTLVVDGASYQGRTQATGELTHAN